MFRLIRLVVLCLMAFVAGVFFERNNQMTLCENNGGTWSGVCAVEG